MSAAPSPPPSSPPFSPGLRLMQGRFDAAPARPFRQASHYLLYAQAGTLQLAAGNRIWSLPPARAALLRADTPATVTLPAPVQALSVLADPGFAAATPPAPLAVFTVTPLFRALLQEAARCPEGPGDDPYARGVRETLWRLACRLAADPFPLHRPAGQSDRVRTALARTAQALDAPPPFAALAGDLGATPRTLARHILAETGMSWRANLQRMRIIHAAELLALPDQPPLPVTEVALHCGYSSLSAFNAAFLALLGVTPTAFRATAVAGGRSGADSPSGIS